MRIYGNPDLTKRTAVVSLTCAGHCTPHQLADWLATEHGVVTRSGYHCAPLAHETIGTLPGEGTIRFSMGYHNSEEEIRLVAALVADYVAKPLAIVTS